MLLLLLDLSFSESLSRLLLLPRCSGEKERLRRRVFLSRLSLESREYCDELTERLRLLRTWSSSRIGCSSSYWDIIRRSGGDWVALRRGDGERDAEVEIVDTEVEEWEDMEREALRGRVDESSIERLRPRSAWFCASVSSAIPFLRYKSV